MPQNYFRDTWNIFDFITVLGSITEIIVDLQVSSCRHTDSPWQRLDLLTKNNNTTTTTTTASTQDTNHRLPRIFLSKFPRVQRSLPPRFYQSRLETIFTICVSHLVCPCFSPLPPPSLYSSQPPLSGSAVPVGEHHQHELPEAFPSGSLDQAAEAGLHHPYPAVDLRTIFQGPLLSPAALKFSRKHAENLSGQTQKSF